MKTLGLILLSVCSLGSLALAATRAPQDPEGDAAAIAEPIVPEAPQPGEASPGEDEPPEPSESREVAASPPAAGSPAAAEDPEPAAVPDLTRMRADRAQAALQAAGLRMQLRDERGNRVRPGLYRSYRVRPEGQSTLAGSALTPGETVRVRGYLVRFSVPVGY